ncbi:MAG: hypothetical protein IT372_21535 [Polyangiaceae bacterium]|nr:hypothetical protein [Polyangiaceae bacterium]
MRSRRSSISLLTLVALGALSGAAGCSPSMETYMGYEKGLGSTKFNTTENEIHCIVYLTGGDQSTRLTFNIKGPAGGIQLSDQEIYPRPSADELGGPATIDVQLLSNLDPANPGATDGPWPAGKYHMFVTLEDADSGDLIEEADLPFEVR